MTKEFRILTFCCWSMWVNQGASWDEREASLRHPVQRLFHQLCLRPLVALRQATPLSFVSR